LVVAASAAAGEVKTVKILLLGPGLARFLGQLRPIATFAPELVTTYRAITASIHFQPLLSTSYP
jgi:hypothetical protein